MTLSASQAATSLRQAITEGLQYILHQPVLIWLLFLLLLVNFILPTSNAQLVLLAKQWFAASDAQVGFLYAGASLGTVLFSLAAGRLRKRWSFGTLMLGSLMLEGLLTAIPIITHWYWMLLLCWTLRGGLDILFVIASYSLCQTVVPNQLLGRVITFIRVLTWSTASIGALLGGIAIEQTHNIAIVYAVVGLLIFVINLLFFLTPLMQSPETN